MSDSIRTVLGVLSEVTRSAGALEVLDTERALAESGFEKYATRAADEVLQAIGVSRDEVEKLRPRLLQALLELSSEEAQVLLSQVKGTMYEGVLAEGIQPNRPPFGKKLQIAHLFWPDYDITKFVDTLMKGLRSQKVPASDPAIRQEFQRTKEHGLAICILLKELITLSAVSPEVVGLAIDVLTLKDPEDMESVSQILAGLITHSNDPRELELLAMLWAELAPNAADRSLRKLLTKGTDPKTRANAEQALIYMGANPVTIVKGDQVMGDRISLTGDFRGANVPVKSMLNAATISINNSSAYDQATKTALEDLIKRLDDALSEAPEEMAEDAEAVAHTAELLVETATQEKPNKTTIKITAEGLLKAAENLAKVLPTVVPIAKQIVALLVS